MPALVAGAGVPFVVMHWRGHSVDMQARAIYDDVVTDVVRELSGRVDALTAAGVDRSQLVLDPGFGFAKLATHNWALLHRLDEVVALGLPVLLGTSRKGFLGRVGVPEGAQPRPPLERDLATAVTSVHAARAGVWAVRVHDVPSTLDALRVQQAIDDGGKGAP
jgi:dihydropteroate synthase